MKINNKEIVQHTFPEDQYVREKHPKKQIVLHHTVSGPGVDGDIGWWKSTKERIATCILIARDGEVHQLYSSAYWAWHLGANNSVLDKQSIGIELDSWGWLLSHNGRYYTTKMDPVTRKVIPNLKSEIPANRVQVYQTPYKGHYAYEKYTPEQIQSVKELLLLWNKTYGIPLTYKPQMWDYSKEAINGMPGVWSHTSYRKDKSDIHPQPELIEMLKSL
jgi:N-acetyl-anhydromuramyl-L-alanine amidase AmpD